jgi:hypothetical protein
VLEVHHRPYDEKRPLVCLDEASKQLVGEVAVPLPAEPGQPERFDDDYTRNGTANLFLISEPQVGVLEEERNERGVVVRWQFTTADARIKLRRLHPTI